MVFVDKIARDVEPAEKRLNEAEFQASLAGKSGAQINAAIDAVLKSVSTDLFVHDVVELDPPGGIEVRWGHAAGSSVAERTTHIPWVGFF
jgi:hypothetical protein